MSPPSHRTFLQVAAVAALAAGTTIAAIAAPAASGGRELRTALYVGAEEELRDLPILMQRIRSAGASAVRLQARWSDIAPASPPGGFDPTDPADPAYNWHKLDRSVQLARKNGLEPIVTVYSAPRWAQGGPDPTGSGGVEVKAELLGKFATALATRYSGRFEAQPRVRYYMVWNEPNVKIYLSPQYATGGRSAAEQYRRLVNAFAAPVHGVSSDNLVIAGGLSPFTVRRGDTVTTGPLRFMRELLCISKRKPPRATCPTRVSFDIWAHHPYTSGGPRHKAFHPDDVSLGDLGEMRALLQAAAQAGHVRRRAPQFWVTEFSWDTSPPDPKGIPVALAVRWTAEALYEMWRSGVTLVTFLQLRDQPFPAQLFQGGLWYQRSTSPRADRPKPTLRSFRFPFVAYPRGLGTLVWGRTPTAKAGSVLIQHRFSGGWRDVASVRAGRNGIFQRSLGVAPTGTMRARFAGEVSSVFEVRRTSDRPASPFGT